MNNSDSKRPLGQIPVAMPQVTPETMELMVANQAREIEVRASELTIQQKANERGFEFATRSMEAQAKDRSEQRIHQRSTLKMVGIFVSITFLIVSALIAIALYLGKDTLVLEIVKAIMYLAAGGAGGYGLKGSKKSEIDSSAKD